VIIDDHLGAGEGKNLCKEIRRFNNWVPVILMSDSPDLVKDCESSGANDSIEKPVDIKELLTRIDKLLPSQV